MTLLDAWHGVRASHAGYLDLRTTDEPVEQPHRINLVQRLLHARIAQCTSLLQQAGPSRKGESRAGSAWACPGPAHPQMSVV